MSPIEILAFGTKDGPLLGHSLPELTGPGSSCSLSVRSLPGSSGVSVTLTNGGGVVLRAEVAAEGDELVEVQIEWVAQDRWWLSSAGRHILYLPVEEAGEPSPTLRPAYRARQLDVALVVDGTMRAGGGGKASPAALLLADRKRWSEHAGRLAGLAEGLAGEMKADLRAAVIAFGDRPVPMTGAADLKPAYHLHPPMAEERSLRRQSGEALRARLLALPPSSGGDFVDALADALAESRELRWRSGARKLVVVAGDSPGYSILQPAPWGSDAQVRERDVDVEAAALHRRGIEIVTLYHAPAIAGPASQFLGPFVKHAREQYLRLATRPELFFETAAFDPAAAVRTLMQRIPALGRGASPGLLAGIRQPRKVRKAATEISALP